jgi:ornithine cyclodeaminase/alanine dehydrogenase-like protein (mu-crystallin family)
MIVISAHEVAARLDYPRAIALVREAMTALSQGRTRQLLRSILDLGGGNAFGVMPGAMDGAAFGAKLVTVFPGNPARGLTSHQGLVLLFDPQTGVPACALDAAEVTAIRTAAASAAATDALARPEAHRLAILGYGEQAWRHACALPHVRPIDQVRVWGRSAEKAQAFAARVTAELGVACEACPSVAEAARGADIVCTTTAAPEPILAAADIADGTHLNVVGSSRAGPAEIETALVARARFYADHRAGVLAQGAEFLRAKAEGLVDDAHVLGEIGEVFAGSLPGRRTEAEVTIYKSLGSIVQDLACGWDLYLRARAEGFGTEAAI